MNALLKILSSLCVFWIIIDASISSKLFEANHSLALSLQNGEKSPTSVKYTIFKLISLLGYPSAISAFLIISYFICPNKIQSLKLILYTLISGYFLSFFKLVYHEPRPYFVYSDLQGIGCDVEFGKPSGHAMVSVILYFLLMDSALNKKYYKLQKNFVQTQEKEMTDFVISVNSHCPIKNLNSDEDAESDKFLSNGLYVSIYLIIVFLVGLSRVVLGVHSFGQVLLGWTYGVVFVIFYRQYGENKLEEILIKITLKQFNDYKECISHVFKILLFNIIVFSIPIPLYYLVDSQVLQSDLEIYILNYSSKPYCIYNPDSNIFLTGKCFIDTGLISMAFGMLISINLTNGTYNPEKWNSYYSELSFIKKILRAIMLAVACALPLIGAHFLSFQNIYMQYIFKTSIPMFLAGISFIKIYPWILKVLSLEIEGDYLKIDAQYGFFESLKSRFNEVPLFPPIHNQQISYSKKQ